MDPKISHTIILAFLKSKMQQHPDNNFLMKV